VSEAMAAQVLSLPIRPQMEAKAQERVVRRLESACA